MRVTMAWWVNSITAAFIAIPLAVILFKRARGNIIRATASVLLAVGLSGAMLIPLDGSHGWEWTGDVDDVHQRTWTA